MGRMNKPNICIDCSNSCGLCNWSANLKPVKGWEAEKIMKRISNGKLIGAYHVISCPKFIRTIRDPIVKEWTPDEVLKLREMMKQRLSAKRIALALNRTLPSINAKMRKIRIQAIKER